MKVSRRTLLRAGAVVGASALLRPATALAERMALPTEVTRMPAIFVGHGSPMLAVDPVRGPELVAWGETLPRPRGIVALTPHVRALDVRIGDTGPGLALYSFPDRFRSLVGEHRYETPPSTELGERVAALLSPRYAVSRSTMRGMNHTVWTPLMHLFPRADVPVLEVALPFLHEAEMFALGRALAPLREEGIIVMGSGSATHNLASIDISGHAPTPAWATEFDGWVRDTLRNGDLDALVDFRARAPAPSYAHPDDGGHYHALLVALGAAVGTGGIGGVRFPVEGFEYATQSKRCVELA